MYSNKYLDKIYSNRFEMAGQRGFEPNNNINYFIDYYINISIDGARGQNRTGTRINLNGF